MTKAEAAQELLRRDNAIADLNCYAMERGFWPARHHQLLTGTLMRAIRGKTLSPRVMVFEGPGTAKSTYTSKLAPPWAMAQPTPHGMPWDILACSHTAELAEDFSRVVRGYVRDEPELLEFGLSDELTNVRHWATSKGDHYRCAGVGQGISGRRGDLGLIDDPVPNREEADSETSRRKVWNWYCDDFRQRLKPTATIVIVMTRWHEDDLAGRILPPEWNGEGGMIQARDGEWWEVVSIPSLCYDEATDPLGRKVGESVWPEWMPLPWLHQVRASMSPRSWSAMHQQQPAPEDGDFFRREWMGRYTAIPTGCRFFLATDGAVTDEDGDWTVHVVVGVDAMNRLYVVDLWRARTSNMAEIADAGLDLVAKWKVATWLGESGMFERVFSGIRSTRMRERNTFCPTETYTRTKRKDEEAQPIRGRWSQGMVMLPEQAPWLAALEHEMLRFPAGRHDDQVDALALIGLHLDKVVAPPVIRHDMAVAQEDRPW